MPLTVKLPVLFLALAYATSPAAAPPLSAKNEQITMKKSGSRIPAPLVATIKVDGVRYEQIKNGLLEGFDQMGGYLAAYDDNSGTRLWTLKVYENQRIQGKEGDVQDIFFKSMTLQADGNLLIENERGYHFIVDPVNRIAIARP